MHDVLILGAGLAGQRAALAAAETGASVVLVSKVHPVRSHSVAAAGGINASVGEGDTWEAPGEIAHMERLGVVGDPAFGPLIAIGAGGTTAELIGDVQVRLAPIGRRDAADMLHSLRTFPLLNGYRGRLHANLSAINDVLLRIAALAAAQPEIAELDCNPLIASQSAAVIVDARVRIAPPAPPHHYGAVDT
jgi:acyl-CoA synthetase (NDP forming)